MNFKSFYNYDIYEDGQVFSHYCGKFLNITPDKHGYKVGSFTINGKSKKIKIHRLVAMLFLNTPENYEDLVVNHKDGNKLNNHFTNLEWCTTYENNLHARLTGLNDISHSNSIRWNDSSFREKTSKAISEGRKKNKCSVGESNPKFKYRIQDIQGNIYSRKELAEKLQMSQSRIDVLIKNSANGISNKHFDKYQIFVTDTKCLGASTIENTITEEIF